MSKIAKKFLFSLSATLILVILCSLYLNSNFIGRYFLYREKWDLARICEELTAATDLTKTITQLEDTDDVLIVQVENTNDNNLINLRLRAAFQEKGLGFQRLWLWAPDQEDIAKKGNKQRVYGQEKLRYSLLVEYVNLGEIMLAAVKIIPAMKPTITLINFVTAVVFCAATLVLLLLIFFLVKRITNPLGIIGSAAKAIAALDFQTVRVKTGDELEVLANDINNMSVKLQVAHNALETKNQQMEALLANVSHELKTPVSLIKVYADGIKDNMDDGTFLDTIIRQNQKMEQLIERLLNLSKLQTSEISTEEVDLSALLHDCILEHQLQAKDKGLAFRCEIAPALILPANKQAVQTIFSNLISNAVKYGVGNSIVVTLKNENGVCLFQVQNKVDTDVLLHTERLWEPFYVADESRNKTISGTGLGLAIVQATAQKYGYKCSCNLLDANILFSVTF